MVLGKKGVSLPINLIIIIIIGLFVFGAAYFGFIKPSQEGSSVFGDQLDAFKDKKFSLMDFDTLTKEEKQKIAEDSPRSIVENTLNSIDGLIPGDCNRAKKIAELLRNEKKVSGFDKDFELTVADIEILDDLIQKADGCIKQGGVDSIDAQIRNINGLIKSGEDGLGSCSSAKLISEGLLSSGVQRSDGAVVMPDQSQELQIKAAIERADLCIEVYEVPLREEKEEIRKANDNLIAEKEWYGVLLKDYDAALKRFKLDVPRVFDFESECSNENKNQWELLSGRTQDTRTKVVGEEGDYSGLDRKEKEIIFSLDDQADYFNFVCKMRDGDCKRSYYSPSKFFEFSDVDLPRELKSEEIYAVYKLEESQCYKGKKDFVNSWKSFEDVKESDKDQSLYTAFFSDYISMLNVDILDYSFAMMNSMKYVEEKITSYGGNDDEELAAFRNDNIIGCPWDFSDYDENINSNPEHCSSFNYAVVSKFLGPYGLDILDDSLSGSEQLLLAVEEGWILDPVLCYWRTSGDNTCNSCKYGSYQGKLNSCGEYLEQSTCELNSCGQNAPGGCRWTGSKCIES